ncbi:GPP34 family phosphoprotein [Microbacterium sp. UBA3394]|uniref:GOLPH3/VPS74 family protein n=1 Tax=Microbacterium sp. UBA3394 TaxID=1946945 RepID=UPI00257B9508|nr:GPP34 family phosphoprotein [Microbacterium sp. UBA3394]|tara:strand:+ start:7018 stop:7758 length:741 start_codon:yes stop_codon:yes gene_type:complete
MSDATEGEDSVPTENDAITGPPTLAEDLLLLLFQPGTSSSGPGTIAGENILFYVLGGAVLAELGMGGHVRGPDQRGASVVTAVAGKPPSDHVLRAAWEYIADKPREIQTVLAAIGPALRGPMLERLIERGDLRSETAKAFGLFTTTVLREGDSGRRRTLLGAVRGVIVDGAQPDPWTAALAALIYASGTLPQFDPEIPWTSAVIARAEELRAGEWGADAAADAVARTITAAIVNNIIIAAAVLPRT